MVYHIVMWNFKRDISEDKKPELKAVMKEKLGELVGKVPGLLSAELVTDPIPSSTHEIALVATLEQAKDVAIYAKHPDHVETAATYVIPYVCDRVCLDYDAGK